MSRAPKLASGKGWNEPGLKVKFPNVAINIGFPLKR